MRAFDISPFSLPNSAPGEVRFEEAREIREIALRFKGAVPRRIAVSYLRDKWPGARPEAHPQSDMENPARFGWLGMDDWFNPEWQEARIRRAGRGRTVTLSFRGLRSELADAPADCDVDFRRTVGLRLAVPNWDQVAGAAVYTCSPPRRSALRVELDAGRKTRGKGLSLSGYNARIAGIDSLKGMTRNRGRLELGKGRARSFEVVIDHMDPTHPYCGDSGLLEFALDHDGFTVALDDVGRHGAVWYAEEGVYVAPADNTTDFAAYRRQHADARTVNQRVQQRSQQRGEQSLAAATNGQPHPHPVGYSFGCKHSPQRFWLDPNGDLLLHKSNLNRLEGAAPTVKRFRNEGNARLLFGLESWICSHRSTTAAPAPVYNLHFKRGDLVLRQQSLCVPLMQGIGAGEVGFEAVTVALLRFTLENTGPEPVEARLPLRYADNSTKSVHTLDDIASQDECLVPRAPLAALTAARGRVETRYRGQRVLRGVYDTDMTVRKDQDGAVLSRRLQPGESCEVVLKVPYLALESRPELAALKGLEFVRCREEAISFWRAENEKGSQLRCPVPQIEELYAAHSMHIQISDVAMPGAPELINTSVGTSTYGNFSNESCMIVQELDQRGFHDDCRRRLDLWVRYQGSVPQPGNFTDYDGMYYGAGGFESGNYNQHHGWVLWCLAEHLFVTGDAAWFESVAESVVAGADWVFRQRRETMKPLPHSRGWEYGFLPAGSLEDVQEFYYWLSTNSLTWRGVHRAAAALEARGHPEAERVRCEADAYRDDLVTGFETMRRHTPLVPLRDGRWVPHYPSRLYCRGRDQGWIREVLEGAVYLLISGLYQADSREGSWILDDFQDNLYMCPPFGYALRDEDANFFHRGGFSIQPCLLAGLMPHLDRDEPEIYLWMLFNAVASVYREEISGMIEHPMPELGFSNAVTFKTSDEANAVMWLRYMYVYWNDELLHLGRALPRRWFTPDLVGDGEVSITGVATSHGRVGVRYRSDADSKRIVAQVRLDDQRGAPRILVRCRHPAGTPIRSVRVDGRPWKAFDPVNGDVDVTGQSGSVEVEARY